MGSLHMTTVIRRRLAAASIGSLAAIALLAVGVASAATVPVSSDGLFAQLTDDRPTRAIVSDDFPNNGNLAGSVPAISPAGSSWLVAAGQITTKASQAQTKGNAPSRASIDLGVSDSYTASTQVSALGSATDAGITLLGNGGTYLYVVYNSGTQTAQLYTSASGTPIASSAPLGPMASFTISIQVAQPTLTVRVNGSVVITHTMTAAESGTYGSLTEAGLLADAKGATFENLTVVSS